MLSFLLISLKALTDQVHVSMLFADVLLDDTSIRAIIAKMFQGRRLSDADHPLVKCMLHWIEGIKQYLIIS